MFRWEKFSAIQKARVIAVIGVVLLTVLVNVWEYRTRDPAASNPILLFIWFALARPAIGFLVFFRFKIHDDPFFFMAVEIPINAIIGLFVVTAIGWTIKAIEWGVRDEKPKCEG